MPAPIIRWAIPLSTLMMVPAATCTLAAHYQGGHAGAPESGEQQRQAHYKVVIEALEQRWLGQVTLTHAAWLNGSRFKLTSTFDSPVPQGLALPQQEDVQVEGGMVFSASTRQALAPERIRVHEYGTFIDLERMARHLASVSDDQWPAPSGRLYQSNFLWLERPASVRYVGRRFLNSSIRVEMTLSDNSRMHFDFNRARPATWSRLHIIRPSATLVYSSAM